MSARAKEGVFVFPEVLARTDERPARCCRCGRPGMSRHWVYSRRVVDLKVEQVTLVQYRCAACQASMTVMPEGIRAKCRHSARTKALSVLLWGLGLSLRNVEKVMKGLGLPISDVGVLKNVRAMGAQAMARHKKAASRIKAPVLGADETQITLSGNGVTVGFLSDPSTGEIVGMRVLASREGEELAQWIMEAAQHFGAKVLVSDELESYKPAAEVAGLSHQLCLAHWRKAVALRLKRIEGYREEKQLIREALKQLDTTALRAIRALHRQFVKARPPGKGHKQSPAYALRMLTLDILENWHRLTCYQQSAEPLRDNLSRKQPRRYRVPQTNNATENAIGRGGKIRAKRMRGFKRADTVLPILFLLACLGGVLAGVSFQSLIG